VRETFVPEATQGVARFGSKVVAVNTALKVVWIAVAVGLLLYTPI
jgi:hypothetical protein